MGKNKTVGKPLKLDFGCGSHPQSDFEGIDIRDCGQKHVLDVRKTPWPWERNSVAEVYSSHFLEHLTGEERVPFFNELYRVMAVGAKATIITPHWSHSSAYGDPTHKWPPISGWYLLYLNREWREINAPHVDFVCDFDWAISGGWDPRIQSRNDEFKNFAMGNYIDSLKDLIATLVKRAPQKP